MLAYTGNPSFWDVVWWMCIFFVWVMWISIVIMVFLDNFRRTDHSGFAKAMWTIFIVFLPVLGVLAYMISKPRENRLIERVDVDPPRGDRCRTIRHRSP